MLYMTLDGWRISPQYRTCSGKKKCSRCASGLKKVHGPYYYGYKNGKRKDFGTVPPPMDTSKKLTDHDFMTLINHLFSLVDIARGDVEDYKHQINKFMELTRNALSFVFKEHLDDIRNEEVYEHFKEAVGVNAWDELIENTLHIGKRKMIDLNVALSLEMHENNREKLKEELKTEIIEELRGKYDLKEFPF